jgi:hypothetical protein
MNEEQPALDRHEATEERVAARHGDCVAEGAFHATGSPTAFIDDIGTESPECAGSVDGRLGHASALDRGNQNDSVEPTNHAEGQGHEARSRNRAREKATNNRAAADNDEWPQLHADAHHGLAGDVVRAIDPHTEADPVAILLHQLTFFGNAIGRGPHYRVEGTDHATNLFTVIVGDTSKARKGTAAGRVREIFDIADKEWTSDCLHSGLSTGEGLIALVRDVVDEDEIKPDKRAMIVETEFASVFTVMRRPGNTLSRVLRDAWDRGDLKSLTKMLPIRATNALISIAGHITEEELRVAVTDLSMANGWANRFLFARVRRSKLLPLGGKLSRKKLTELGRLTAERIAQARSIDVVGMTPAARRHWARIYPDLSKGHPGLYGAITGRAEAQAIRLALLYALLDGKDKIDVQHLLAASAVWAYCEASARQIFGTRLGNPVAHEILGALTAADERGMTRTEISHLFKRHRRAEEIKTALETLTKQGKIRNLGKSLTAGRSIERWAANKAN